MRDVYIPEYVAEQNTNSFSQWAPTDSHCIYSLGRQEMWRNAL